MKKIVTLSILVALILALGAGCIPWQDVDKKRPRPTSKPVAGISKDALLAKSTLSSQGQGLYEKICDAIEKQETFFEFEEDVTISKVKKIVASVQADRPQYFWFENYLWYANEGSQLVNKLELKYTCTQKERQRRQAIINDYYGSFAKGVSQNASEYTRLKYTHDYVINNTQYDLDSADNQNIVSVFVNGKSVCAGYARAMQYLLKKQGIRCAYINGVAKGRGSHAWNIVVIDGATYYVDATWDDPAFGGEQRKNYISYSYFCVTTKEIVKTHTAKGNLIKFPNCTATAANYFIKEGLYFRDLGNASADAMKTALYKAINEGTTFFAAKFGSAALVDEALQQVLHYEVFAGTSVTYSKDPNNNVLVIFLN